MRDKENIINNSSRYETPTPETPERPWQKRWDVKALSGKVEAWTSPVRAWSKKKKLGVVGGIAAVLVIIIAVVTGVEVAKNNAYPNYKRLAYTLRDSYSGTDFFDQFEYWDTHDPTHGFVQYVNSAYAELFNLTYATNDTAVVKVDTTVTPGGAVNLTAGRYSVRIESKRTYSDGLFVFDVKHTPTGCATWPALWLADTHNWPFNGEVDIMEAVNVIDSGPNVMTLHTSKGCDMSVKRKQKGKPTQADCKNSTNFNAGCGVRGSPASFGQSFNEAGGAIMAMELRNEGIRVWQFPRDRVPVDLKAGMPDPSSWEEPDADFPNTHCDMARHFRNQSIIINIDLCGDWAGNPAVFGQNCPGICSDYVTMNNTAFKDAYWEFGEFQIYQASIMNYWG